MHPPSNSAATARFPRVEVDFALSRVTWHLAGDEVVDGHHSSAVPWFDSIGVLDYASAEPATAPQPREAGARLPVYGDALIVRPDLAAVFWRAGSVLHSAPIRCGLVDFGDAAAVEWSASLIAHGQLLVIEHNLAQCSTLPTVDPPLHVVQVDRSGRLSLSFLVADVDGSPVIGPTPRHYQPWIYRDVFDDAARQGLPAVAAMWQSRLDEETEDGTWRFIPPAQVLDTLIGLGFAVTGPAAEQPGLVAAFDAARGSQWTSAWYGDSRLLTLARFERGHYGRDGQYTLHQPGHRRIAADKDSGWYGMLAQADVESLPSDQLVRMVGTFRSKLVRAGQVALHEPDFIDGTLPVLDNETDWAAHCRRCDVPLSSGEVGQFHFTPYVHELTAFLHHNNGPGTLWCPAHPSKDRLRPHAPVCRPVERPRHR